MNYQILGAIAALLGLCFGYWLQGQLNTKYKRKRAWRNVKCMLGFHQPGPVRRMEMRERDAMQLCDWCDKVVRRWDIDKEGTYRRIR